MNREAVALGTPVCTTFEGRLGAVDERLIAEGRLRRARAARTSSCLVKRAARARRRARPPRPGAARRPARASPVGPTEQLSRPTRTIARMRRRLRSAALPLHRHSLPQLAVDAALVALAYYLAFRLRFDGGIPQRYEDLLEATIAAGGRRRRARRLRALPALREVVALRRPARLHGRSSQAVVVATLVLPALVALIHPVDGASAAATVARRRPDRRRSPLFFLLTLVLVGGARFVARTVYERPLRGFRAAQDARRVLIVGAGDGGRLVLREILRNPDLRPAPGRLRRRRPDQAAACGSTACACSAATDELAAHPRRGRARRGHRSRSRRRRARCAPASSRACRARGIPVRTLPTVFELLQTGGGVVRQARAVQVEDILGREPVRMELDRVGRYLDGEVVLVTGAGGSIGSELCRQIARVGAAPADPARPRRGQPVRDPARAARTTATSIPTSIAAVLADCKEGERMREVFAEHRPTVVFHAAAYKHVGLMELNPVEAVRNNALATRLMARVAGETGVKRFVLVSTDKAVHAGDGHGRVQGAGRVRRRGRRRSAARHALRDRALRQRARLDRARSSRSSAARSRSAAR